MNGLFVKMQPSRWIAEPQAKQIHVTHQQM
jgi:hypothetical protein